MNDTFSARLKTLRLDTSKTQEDVANLLNIKRSTYGEYERGKIMPPVDKIEQLANIFGVKPHYLIGWDTPEVGPNKSTSPLADKIKELRKSKHKTIEELSEEIGIPLNILVQYENGVRKIPYTALKKLASYFGVDLILLFGIEFGSGQETREELKEGLHRLKLAEIWNREVGRVLFADDEHAELVNYAKYLLSKRCT